MDYDIATLQLKDVVIDLKLIEITIKTECRIVPTTCIRYLHLKTNNGLVVTDANESKFSNAFY